MTRIEVFYCGRVHTICHQHAVKLSVPLCFADNPINLYGAEPAHEQPLV